MVRYLFALCLLAFVAGCNDKKKPSLSEDGPVEVGDFIDFFPETPLPFSIADTLLEKKETDSSRINYAVFTRFIPDSVISRDFGKTAKPRIYPLGKAIEKGKETYLFIKAAQGNKQAGYLVCFNKKNEYLNAIPIVKNGFDAYTSAYGSLDKKFQINTYRERQKKDGTSSFKRNVYIYNSASNEFTLILTEPNEEMINTVINPLDTLSHKNKYTGDYPRDKKNFLSFRDGKTPSEVLFFAHFEKDGGDCIGELKGRANFISPKTARYKENGNPCTLEFTFTSSSVIMKEVEGCGSYRDIKCFFEGTFPKKKEPKPKTTRKK